MIKNIIFITNIIPYYRKTFYEKLCSFEKYKWQIVKGVKEKEDGRPDYKAISHIPVIEVNENSLKIGPYTIRWQKGILNIIREKDPDLIILLGIVGYLSNWIVLTWARLKNVPIIMWTCGWEAQKQNSLSLFLKKIVMSKFYSLPSLNLVYSSKAKKYLVGMGISPEKIIVNYNGIEIDDLMRNKEKIIKEAADIRISENILNEKVFLYVGGLVQDKKVDFLLKAFAKFSQKYNSFLWIVGDGPEINNLKALTNLLELKNVKYWGRIIEDSDKYFKASDFVVLPGIGGLAIAQAMFWGKPCIVSEADGTEEDLVVENETGFRFENDNLDSIINAMERAIRLDSLSIENIAKKCQEIILDRQNVSNMVNTFIKSIECIDIQYNK